MNKAIYLSAATHGVDNPTKCPVKCGENTHCRAYMDIVERRLKECGAQVWRGYPEQTGDIAMKNRVNDANKRGAAIYYVAHTNAGGGRYSMTMCWPSKESIAAANVIHKYRKCVSVHKVVARTDLYEIKKTKGICLYDELFFHDNEEDCTWFHKGGMELLAEETVQALCELAGVKYKAPIVAKPEQKPAAKPAEKPAPPKTPKAGDTIKLAKGKLYLSSTGKTYVTRTGTFYLYDGKKVNGRYRVTNKVSRVGKTPVALHVSGWVAL